MIYIVGDSHSIYTFQDVPNVTSCHIGAITLKRIGYMEDTLLTNQIKLLNLQSDDIVFFCFGEIDVRCYIKPNLEHRLSITLDSLLQEWIDSYIYTIETLNLSDARRGIMSVVPPPRLSDSAINNKNLPFPGAGTNEERAIYAKKINEILIKKCEEKNWLYLDIYSLYVDDEGLLKKEKTLKDGLHIDNQNKEVHSLMLQQGLIKL